MNPIAAIRHRLGRGSRIEAALATILVTLKEFQMSATNSLANLTAAVANETTVDQSVMALITTLLGEIQSASPTGDNPAIDALVTQMQTNATALAAAVTANTPPPPAPAA